MNLEQIKVMSREELVRLVTELLAKISNLEAENARLKKGAPSRK